MQIWIHACDDVPAAISDCVQAGLEREGLEVRAPGAWPPPNQGVLVFGRASEEVCRLVRAGASIERRAVIALHVSIDENPEAKPSPWQLLAAGAMDFLHWSEDHAPREIAARLRRRSVLDEHLNSSLIRENLIGQSSVWSQTLEQLVEAAAFSQESILLTGESGTGKELAARLTHALDPRPGKKELVVVDCTTLMPDLAGSELFGHERGAYTGAAAARAGAIQMAHEGTLFLDEVGELGLSLQAQLLRVIQEKTYKRVGGDQWHKADFRLVAATNRDLWSMVQEGTFRRDLYYRIATVLIALPPLRERPEDVLPLARHFLRQMRPRDADELTLDPALEAHLMTRDYPGNVRDLRQLIARILHRHRGTRFVSPASLPERERPSGTAAAPAWPDEALQQSLRRALAYGVGLQDIAREAKEAALNAALSLESGSVKRAAERLGVTERAIHMRLAKTPASLFPRQQEDESA